MGERSANSSSLINRKPMFFLFTLLTLLCLSSCFFLLGTTDHSQFVDNGMLSNFKIFSMIEQRKPLTEVQETVKLSSRELSFFSDNNEPEGEDLKKCDPSKPILKVFMYDLPPEFHFGLLGRKSEGDSVWPDISIGVPDYPGGLNLQHSIEYWLTLDLLSSRLPDRKGSCTAVRVGNSQEADVVFVPFFSSLSYNRHSKINPPANVSKNKLLQDKLVQYLTDQEEWKRSGGHDHIILAHHPNSMLDARMKLWPCMFILSDFGRYPPNVANVEKDVIAPYKHMIKTFVNDSTTYNDRPILLYFQGAIYRKDGGFIRQELFYLLRGEIDVHFSFGSIRENGINNASRGMHSSKYCLNIAGDTPSSNRLFDAIASHCVPVIISDEIELPFEDVLDYSEFCIFVRTSDALKKGFLVNLVRNISKEEWTQKWNRLKEVENFFEYQYPSQKGDAVQMIWQAVSRKVPAIKFKLNKSRRFSRFADEIQRQPSKNVSKTPSSLSSNFK